MTKAELLKLLEPLDDNDTIILSRDSEGNSYRKLSAVEAGWVYVDGDLFLEELTEEDIRAEFSQDDVCTDPDAVAAIVFY